MKKQDILSILITLTVGLLAGGYLYLTGFAEFATKLTVPSEQRLADFTVVSELYGGCQRADSCSSWQVLSDGSYRYFSTPDTVTEEVLRTGNIPLVLQKDLHDALEPRQLKSQSQTIIDPVICNSYSDGTDVTYMVTIGGVEYTLDSCKTAVDGHGELWTALNAVWTYLQTDRNNN